MTPQQIRLELLKIVTPAGIANLDTDHILRKAKALEEYVVGEGQAQAAPSTQPAHATHKPGYSANQQNRHK